MKSHNEHQLRLYLLCDFCPGYDTLFEQDILIMELTPEAYSHDVCVHCVTQITLEGRVENENMTEENKPPEEKDT